MVRKCSFSGVEIKEGTGIMYVTKEGKIYHFANSKCKKNFLKLGRIARKLPWITKTKKRSSSSSQTESKEA